jgi:hypothetical protein
MMAKMRQRTVLARAVLATLETGGAKDSPVADKGTSALLRAMGAYLDLLFLLSTRIAERAGLGSHYRGGSDNRLIKTGNTLIAGGYRNSRIG